MHTTLCEIKIVLIASLRRGSLIIELLIKLDPTDQKRTGLKMI